MRTEKRKSLSLPCLIQHIVLLGGTGETAILANESPRAFV